MQTIDDIKAIHGNATATLGELTAAADAARALAAASEGDVAALNERRPRILLAGTDKDLARLDEGIAVASRTVERATAFASALDARAVEVRAERDERARAERYATAVALLKALPAEVEADYRKATALFHGLLEKLARADIAIAAVNADLPEGAAPLHGAENFRHVPAIEGGEVGGKPYWLWCTTNGVPIDDQARVKPRSDGMGWTGEYEASDENGYPIPWGVREVLVKRLPFRDVTIRAPKTFRNPGPLASELAIPPLHGETATGWTPLRLPHAQHVLDALPERNAALAPTAGQHVRVARRMVLGTEREALMAKLMAGEIA